MVYNFSFKTADLSKDRWSAESNSQASKRLTLISNTVPELSVTASEHFALIHSSILITTHYAQYETTAVPRSAYKPKQFKVTD